MSDEAETFSLISPSAAAQSYELPHNVLCIDHIAVAVVDLDEAINWYVRVLGFSLVERRITQGNTTAMASAVIKAGNVVVVLIQGLCAQSQVSRFIERFGPGVQHVAFEVADLDAALRQLERCGGAQDTDIINGRGIRQVFLRRDGASAVRIELIERRGGNFSDDSVEQLFRKFEADGLY